MKKNIGNADRLIRMFVAALIAVLYLTHVISGTFAIVLLAVAVIFLLTAFVGTCPIYLGLGMSTNRQTEVK